MRRIHAVVLVALLVAGTTAPAGAEDPVTELDRVRNEIASLTSQIEAAQSQRSDVARELEAAEAEVSEVLDRLAEAQAAIDAVEVEIAGEEAVLADLRAQLDRLRRALAATRAELTATQADLELQVVEMYMNASASMGPSLLSFDSAAQLAVGLSYTDRVAGDSEDRVDGFVALKAEEERQQGEVADRSVRVQETLDQLAVRKAELDEDLAEVAELQRQAEEELTRVQNLLGRINSDIAAAEQHKESLEAESARLAEEIRNNQSSGGTSPGVLGWPVSGPVTSGFGYRIHPIYGTRRMHEGIDISVGSGVPILAAEDGAVIYAGWMGGYGNVVVIDHGGGLSTLYAHQSSVGVGSGYVVSRGSVIGYVGCTGSCTGPHLHFETRVNGDPVDPMGYLG
jgi:murein DD-endopeptidase MepM/ murein hydrolase activator NlpD